jgi:hypothetical protein
VIFVLLSLADLFFFLYGTNLITAPGPDISIIVFILIAFHTGHYKNDVRRLVFRKKSTANVLQFYVPYKKRNYDFMGK